MSNTLFASVIIPTYHDWQRLQLCLDALRQQTLPSEYFEIIIVNNDSSDMPSIVNKPENAIIIAEDKPGSYAARNAGINTAKGDILAFTDSDCIPYNNWLVEGIKALTSSEDIQRIAGHIELFYRNDKLTWAVVYQKVYAFPQQTYASIGIAATANMMTYSECFETVGSFNEQMLSSGDVEWGLRAQRDGLPIAYAEHCIVKHPARHKMKELTAKIKRVSGGHIQGALFSYESQPKQGNVISRQYKRIRSLFAMQNLSLREKAVCLFVLYYIMILRIFYNLLIKEGLIGLERT